MRRILLTLLILVTGASTAQAQVCTSNVLDGFNVQFTYGGAAAGSIGQTYTACQTGYVTMIRIHEGATSTGGPYSLWLAAEAGGGNTGYTGGPAYAVVPDPGGAFPRITNLAVSPPFPVTGAAAYRFVLNHAGIINIRCTNGPAPSDYPGGEATDDFGTYSTYDLDFEVVIDAGVTPADAATWGRIKASYR